MANRYWVGGSGTWSSTATANWSATSGGSGGASAPTSADTVIFDQAGTYTVTVSGSVAAATCLDFVISAGTVTFEPGGAATNNLNIFGSVTWTVPVTWSGNVGSTNIVVNFTATSAKNISTGGYNFTNSAIVFNGVGGSWTLQNNLTVDTFYSVTLTAGTLALGSYTLTAGNFSSNNSNTRSINFGTGKIVLTRNASNVVWDTGTVTGLTVSGTSLVEVPGNASNAVTKTITTGTLSEANSISFDLSTTGGCNFNITGGVFKNLSITGNVTIANTAITIYGNYTRTTGTIQSGTSAWTFGASSGTQQLNSGGVTHDFPIIKTGAGILQLVTNNFSLGITRSFTLTQGTLDLNNLILNTGTFSSTNSNTRSIDTKTSGQIILKFEPAATTTIWDTTTTTNFTSSGTGKVVVSGAGAGTKTISTGAMTEAQALNWSLESTAGTTLFTAGNAVKNLTINGTFTLTNIAISIFGDLSYVAGTLGLGTNAWTFAATSGTKLIYNGSITYDFPWTFNGVGGTWSIQNNLTLGATRALTLTNGTLNFNDKTLSGGSGITITGGSAAISSTGASTFSTSLPITHTSGTFTVNNTNLTTTNASGYTLTAGTLNLSNNGILTAPIFTSNNANTREIQFGANGRIDVTGNNTTVLNFATATGFTYTGTPRIYSTYTGGTGTRIFNFASTAGAVAPNPNATPAVQGNVFNVSFDTSIGATGLVIITGSDTKTLTGAFNNIDLTNITGSLTNSARTIYGDLYVPSGSTALAAGTAVTTFAGLASQYITSNAVTLDFPITINSTGGVNLNGALTLGSTRTLTLTGGGLNLADYTLTAQLLSSSGSTSRTIYFANTGQITLTGGNAVTVMDFSTATGFTYEGTPRIYSTYNSATGTRTFLFGTTAGATSTNVLDVNFGSSGTGIVISTATDTKSLQGSYNNVNLTNFAGTISNNTRSIYGNFTVPAAGGTLTSGASITSFVTTSTQTITTNGRVLNFPITVAGTGTTTLGDAVDLGSTSSITLTTGTLALANFTLTTQTLVSNNANTRSINFGSTGQINITGNNATILNFTTATGFTYTGTPRIYSTYTGATGTRTFNFGGTAGHTSTNVFDVSFGTSGTGLVINSTGADAKALQGGYGAFNLTGMTGTLALDARTVYGNFTVPAGATPTITAGSTATTFATTSTQTITTNGRNLDFAVTINNTGTTVLGDALNIGNRTFTLTAGTFDTNDFTVTAAALSSSNSNARTIAFDTTGQFTLTANAATIVDFAIMTDFSYTGTPRIYSTNTSGAAASTRTFNFGSTVGALPHNVFDLSIGTSGTGLVIAAAASDILSLNGGFNNFDLSGLTGTTQTIGLTARTVFGNFVVPATGGTINTGLTTTTISAPSTAPVANGYSAYFDGANTSFLSVPGNTAFAFGTDAFTIECWVNVSTAQRVVTNRTSGASAAGTWSLTVGPTSVSFTEVVTGEPGVSGGVGTASIANTWAHVAVCRDSGTTKIFVNGNQVASAVQTTNFTNTANIINIGRSPGDGSIVGCISNLRIVKGQAVYFSNFTPSTQPLTTSSQGCDPTKVSLLTCQTEDFIDASQNNFTITRNGAAHPAYLSPFGAQTATTKNVTTNGRVLGFHVQFGTPISGSGINTLQDNFDVGSANTYAIRFGNGTLDVNNRTVSGSSAGITVVNGCSFTLNNTGGSTVTTSMPITHTNGSLTLGTNLTTTNASGYTLTLGDLVINGKTITTPVFSSNNSNYRWIKTNVGGIYSGKIIINSSSNGTVWNTATTTNLMIDGLDVESIGGGTSAITKTLNFGTNSGFYPPINLSILDTTASGAPNYTVTATNQISNLTINASVTSFTNSAINIGGNYSYSTTNGTTTFAAGTNAWTFDGVSGYNYTINPGSATYDFPWIIGSTGATAWDSTWTLQSNLILGATRSLTLRRAEIDFNNYAISGGNGLTINPGSSGAVATTKVKSTGTSTFTTSLPITHTTGYLDLAVNLTTSSTSGYTLTAGTVGLNTYTLTTPVFSSSNANTRSINFGTGKILLTSSITATVWTTTTVTNLTTSGTGFVEVAGGNTAGTAITKTISAGALNEANSISFKLADTAADITHTFTASNTVKNLTIDGRQTLANIAITIYGNYSYATTSGFNTTFTGGANAWTFAGTTDTKTITSAAVTHDFPWTFSGSAASVWQLGSNITLGTTRTTTLTTGDLMLQSYTLSTGLFASNNSNTREINFGTGKIELTSATTSTVWNTATVTNMTVSGTPLVECKGGGTAVTKTISAGTPTEANTVSFSLLETTGTAIYAFTAGNNIRNLLLNGTQTLSNIAINIYGDYTNQVTNGTTNMVQGANAWTFAATSGTKNIDTDFDSIVSGSVLFDGVDDRLDVAYNANQALTNQNFTIECWVYVLENTGTINTVNAWYGTGGQFLLQFNASGRPLFNYVTGSTTTNQIIGTTTSAVRGTWNHIAAVRNGSTITLYVNGVADATTGSPGANALVYYGGTAKDIRMGADTGGAGDYSNCYLSNVRIVIGTAVYTGNFTPPKLAHLATSGSGSAAAYPSTTNVNTTFAASQTNLLTCQSATSFVDNSNNAFTVTAISAPAASTFGLNYQIHDFPWTFNGAGGTWLLQQDTYTGVTRTVTLTNGTLNINGKDYSIGLFATGAGTKNLTFNGGELELNGGGTAFNNAQPTNFTTTAGSANGTIRTKSPAATTFAGGGSSYAATLAQDGAALTITGSNTFYDISTPCTARSSNSLTLAAGTTQTVTNFTATGQYTGQLENNLLSILSSVAGTQATIYATSGLSGYITGSNYLSCTDIAFTPFSTDGSDYIRWYIGDNSVQVNNCRGAIFKTYSANTSPKVYLLESGSSWTTPSDFNVNDNIIHLIGGGGGGASGFGGTGTDYGGGGGGGGGYTKVINYYSYSQLPVTFTVGGGGSGGVGEGGSATSGGTTTFSTYTAAGGTGPTGRIGGAGGVGSTYTGGNGGTGPATENGNSGGGGGGAAGPLGNGGNGGNGDNTGGLTRGGGGGGGNGGGTAGAASNSSSGATGGNNAAGQGGAGSNANGTAGGGGGGRPAGGGGGGLGSFGIDILNSFGSGGGSGGGGSSGGTGAAGLGYGSAGGGGGVNNSSAGWNGGNGYQGVIIIQYVPGTAPLPASAKMFMMFT